MCRLIFSARTSNRGAFREGRVCWLCAVCTALLLGRRGIRLRMTPLACIVCARLPVGWAEVKVKAVPGRFGKTFAAARSGFSEPPGARYGLTQVAEVPGFGFHGGMELRGRVACRISVSDTLVHCKHQESRHGRIEIHISISHTNEKSS